MASVLLHVVALASAAAAASELVTVLEAFDGPADGLDVFGRPSSLTRSTKSSRHSSSDTQNHGLSPLSTSRSLPQALTRDSSLGGSSSKSPNSLVWTASAPRPVVPPSPHNEDRV